MNEGVRITDSFTVDESTTWQMVAVQLHEGNMNFAQMRKAIKVYDDFAAHRNESEEKPKHVVARFDGDLYLWKVLSNKARPGNYVLADNGEVIRCNQSTCIHFDRILIAQSVLTEEKS